MSRKAVMPAQSTSSTCSARSFAHHLGFPNNLRKSSSGRTRETASARLRQPVLDAVAGCDRQELLDLLLRRRRGGRSASIDRLAYLEEHPLQPGGGDENEQLGRSVALVLERVWRPDRHVGERPGPGHEPLAADLVGDLTFDYEEACLFPAAELRGWPPPPAHERR